MLSSYGSQVHFLECNYFIQDVHCKSCLQLENMNILYKIVTLIEKKMARAAVVKIVYVEDTIRVMSVIRLYDEDDGHEKALAFVRQNLVIPKDVSCRTELLICDIDHEVIIPKPVPKSGISHVRMKAIRTQKAG